MRNESKPKYTKYFTSKDAPVYAFTSREDVEGFIENDPRVKDKHMQRFYNGMLISVKHPGSPADLIVFPNVISVNGGETFIVWKSSDLKKRLGEVIFNKRMDKGMSIRDLADKCGMSKNNIVRIEEGKYNYTIDTLGTIAGALGLHFNLEWLSNKGVLDKD